MERKYGGFGRMAMAWFTGVLWVACGMSAAHAKQEHKRGPNGFVIGRLAQNVTRIDMVSHQYAGIAVRGGPNQASFALTGRPVPAVFLGPRQTTLHFARRLPPGRYRIAALDVRANANAELADSLPEFDVVAGEVTDLGLLVMQPLGAGSATLIPVDDGAEADEELQAYFADEAAEWSGKPITKWTAAAQWAPRRFAYGDVGPSGLGLVVDVVNARIAAHARKPAQVGWSGTNSAADLLALAKAYTVILSKPAVASDGTMYFGSGLGQILRRTPEGRWSNLETGQLREVSAVELLADGTLIAGTENGRLLQQEPATGKFMPVTKLAAGARILDLHHWQDGTWWVTTREGNEKSVVTNVYSANSLSAIDRAPIKTVTQGALGSVFAVPPYVDPVAGAAKYFLSVPGVEMHTYDLIESTWTRAAQKKAVMELITNNSGSVLASMKALQLSADDGASWASLKSPGTVLHLGFFNKTDGYAIVAPTSMGSPEMQLHRTADGGKTWSLVNRMERFPCDLRTLRQNDEHKRIICVFHDSNIYSSAMQGHWTAERAVR